MQYVVCKLGIFIALLTSIVTIGKDPILFIKNKADRTIQMQIQLNSAQNIDPILIDANTEWNDLSLGSPIPANTIQGLAIKYCSANTTCPDSSAFDKEYTVNFKNPKTTKY